MTEETGTKESVLFPDESFKEMVDAGVFFGSSKSKTHPRMRQYILTTRNGIEIIDLDKTKEVLLKALEFLKEKAKGGATLLFVGTQPAAAEGIASIAAELGAPAVLRRWLGGTLTNFKVIAKRIEYWKKLKEDWEKKAFEEYTKKERLHIEHELQRLNELLSGMEQFTTRPEVLVVIDPRVHKIAVAEARHLHIPVVAFVNSDADPDATEYPVPGNIKARLSVNWFLGKVKEAVLEAQKARVAEAAAVAEKEKAPAEDEAKNER